MLLVPSFPQELSLLLLILDKIINILVFVVCCIFSLFYVHFSVSYCCNEARICIHQIPDCYSIRTYLGVL